MALPSTAKADRARAGRVEIVLSRERRLIVDAAIDTAALARKLNDVDPQAWLADVLGRIADLPQSRLPELLPWAWHAARPHQRDAA